MYKKRLTPLQKKSEKSYGATIWIGQEIQRVPYAAKY